jgi:hypothetical protein
VFLKVITFLLISFYANCKASEVSSYDSEVEGSNRLINLLHSSLNKEVPDGYMEIDISLNNCERSYIFFSVASLENGTFGLFLPAEDNYIQLFYAFLDQDTKAASQGVKGKFNIITDMSKHQLPNVHMTLAFMPVGSSEDQLPAFMGYLPQ